MTPRLQALLLSAVMLACAGCEREKRRVHEPEHLNTPAIAGAQNPYLSPGTAAPPPVPMRHVDYPSHYESNAFMVARGKQLYVQMNCIGCHANGGGGMGPPLIDDEWLYGIEPVNVYQSIVEGRQNGMPSYRGKLTEVQVWQIVAYVRSMSGQLRKDVSPGRTDHMRVKPSEHSTPQENPNKQEDGAEKKESPR